VGKKVTDPHTFQYRPRHIPLAPQFLKALTICHTAPVNALPSVPCIVNILDKSICSRRGICLVSVSGGVILRTDNQTATLLRSTVDSLDDINQLLLVLQHPVQLVIVAGAEIAHHVLVAEEKHEGDGIIESYICLKSGTWSRSHT